MYNFSHDKKLVANFPNCQLGEGFGKLYTKEELVEAMEDIAASPRSGRRLLLTAPGCRLSNGTLELPPGFDRPSATLEWGILNRPTGQDWQIPKDLQILFKQRGLVLDQHGRPCHPLYEQLMGPEGPGLSTGIGKSLMGEAVHTNIALIVQGRLFMRLVDGELRLLRVNMDRGRFRTVVHRQKKVLENMTAERMMTYTKRYVFNRTEGCWVEGLQPRIVRAVRPLQPGTLLNRWALELVVVLSGFRRLPPNMMEQGTLLEPSDVPARLHEMSSSTHKHVLSVFGS